MAAFGPDQCRDVVVLDTADMAPAAMEAELRRDCTRVLLVVVEVPRLPGSEGKDIRLGKGWASGRLGRDG